MKKNIKAKIIVLSSEKGGVGKSTTSYNLATNLIYKRKSVLLIDLDIQRSCHKTFEMRKQILDAKIAEYDERLAMPLLPFYREKYLKIRNEIKSLRNKAFEVVSLNENGDVLNFIKEKQSQYEYIIIDTKCNVVKQITKDLFEIADLVIFPYLDSVLDLSTAENIDTLIRAIKDSKPQLKTEFRGLLVCDNSIGKKELNDLELFFSENFIDSHQLLINHIKKRKIYKEAMLAGRGINETNHQYGEIAKKEFEDLVKEILTITNKKGEK